MLQMSGGSLQFAQRRTSTGPIASSCARNEFGAVKRGLSRRAMLVQCKQKTTSGRKGEQNRKAAKEPPPNKLDVFMRKHPVLSRVYDTKLILGDCTMILATQVSSDRICMEDALVYAGVMMVCWIAVGAYLGDYKGDPPGSDNWYMSLLGPSFASIVNTTITWAGAATASLAVLSALGSQNVINAIPLVPDVSADGTSPQLEITVAMLITMMCYRGIANQLRYNA